MAKHHPHRHPHPHPHGKQHHHAFVRKGKRPGPHAHEHPISILYGRPRPPSVSTPRIKRVWRAVHTWYTDVVSLGIYNRRKIAGSNTWSQHSWADAWDMATEVSVKTGAPTAVLDEMVSFVRALGLWITRVIYRDSSHQNHGHIDVEPEQTGTPP